MTHNPAPWPRIIPVLTDAQVVVIIAQALAARALIVPVKSIDRFPVSVGCTINKY